MKQASFAQIDFSPRSCSQKKTILILNQKIQVSKNKENNLKDQQAQKMSNLN